MSSIWTLDRIAIEIIVTEPQRPAAPSPDERAGADGSDPAPHGELTESERRLRRAARAAGFGTFAWDFGTRRGDYSAEFLSLYDLAAGEEVALGDDQVPIAVHPDDRAAYTAAASAALDPEGSGLMDLEFRVRRASGEIRWLRVRGRTTFAGGRPVSAHGILDDVTERRRADEQLEVLRFSIDHAPTCAYWLDPNGTFVYANAAGCAALGYSFDELVGMKLHEVNPHGTPENWQRVWQYVRDNGVRTSVSEHRKKDGTTFPVEITSSYFKYGDREYCNGFATDLTLRRQAERDRDALQAQLVQAQKMESIGRLAGGVAHDFNNMLEVIVGNTELALAEIAPGAPLHAELTEVRAAAERSAELVKQLLAFARRQPSVPRVIDLNHTVEGMLRMLQRLLGEDIDLAWRPANDAWPVRIDPSQVTQILANLAVNARDAISGVGTLRISTRNVVVDATNRSRHPNADDGEYVALSLEDSGCGMSPETLENIFEPLFTTKPLGVGTGLGLATVYGIVTQNAGFVEVKSAAGVGSTFTIHLPRHLAPALESVPAPSMGRAHGGRETILLVEDEPAIVRVCRRMLERQGYRVLTAALPSEALRIVQAHAGGVDLLIADVVMPEMNGRELSERLAQLEPGLRTLYMSGYPANFVAQQGMQEVGLHFLPKPFSAAALTSKVREALDSK